MPPKRKRTGAEGAEETVALSSSRATRSSARSSAAKGASSGSKTSAAKGVPSKPIDDAASDITEDVPQPKKSRPASSKATTAKTRAPKASATKPVAEDSTEASPVKTTRTTKSKSKAKINTHDATTAGEDEVSSKSKKPATTSTSGSEHPRYSSTEALKLFNKYADPDDPNVIGPEGLETLCTDAGIPMEGAQPLILAWQLGTKEMAKIQKAEWMKGTEELKISSPKTLGLALQDLEDLLILSKPLIQQPTASVPVTSKRAGKSAALPEGPYNRDRYFGYASRRKAAFAELYQFCFGLSKTEGSRNIDMEMATAFWSVLVVPKYSIMSEIIEFINVKGTFKGVNKDLWQMTLEFCEAVNPNLDNYEADGAWPTMLDEFVTWKKGKEVKQD